MPEIPGGFPCMAYGHALILALCLVTGWLLYGAIWRLYLSPIAGFPGPRFAALTFWNEFYYDVIRKGQYTWKIVDYHKKYGPIIRINPYELHIYDPQFYEVLYVGGSKRKSDKWFWSMRMFGFNDVSTFDTLDHDAHRMRREPWNPYFSKQQVSRLQPTFIQPLVDKFCDRLAEYQAAKKPVTMIYAFANLTSDIISEYSFSKGYGNLERPYFHGDDYNAWMALSKTSHLLKQFGWLFPMMYSFPLWVTRYTSPETYRVLCQQNDLFQQAQEAISQRNRMEIKETTGCVPMMQAFLNSNLPKSEKAAARMKAEAQSAISAGTLTTSHALKVATYHVLANPPILTKLMDELYQVGVKAGSPRNLQQLEQMPYLMAIWYESLRHFHGACHRLQRIFPDAALRYKEWVIPPGTPVGMTSLHVHEDEDIFPDHYAFNLERWLPLQTEGQRLLKYMFAFGAGSRSCVGRELGKAEFLTTMATMFQRFGKDMELYDTYRERDIDIKHDYFNPAPSDESNGLMVFFNKK